MGATEDGSAILTRPRPSLADIVVTDSLRTVRASRPAPKNGRSTLLTQQMGTIAGRQYRATASLEFASDWACLIELADLLALDVDDAQLPEALRANAILDLQWLIALLEDDPEEVVSSVRVHRRNGEMPINGDSLPASAAAWGRTLGRRMKKICLN